MNQNRLAAKIASVIEEDADEVAEVIEANPEEAFAAYQDYRHVLDVGALRRAIGGFEKEEDEDEESE